MHTTYNPETVSPPFGAYSHGVEAPAGARWLHVSGQVGVMPDGTMADGIDAQCEWAWKNLISVLEAAGMSLDDVVKVTTYLLSAEDVPIWRKARDQVIGDARPAATLCVISALAGADWLVEIEAIAAKS